MTKPLTAPICERDGATVGTSEITAGGSKPPMNENARASQNLAPSATISLNTAKPMIPMPAQPITVSSQLAQPTCSSQLPNTAPGPFTNTTSAPSSAALPSV